MPLAKIHVLEGRYDERRLSNVSKVDSTRASMEHLRHAFHRRDRATRHT